MWRRQLDRSWRFAVFDVDHHYRRLFSSGVVQIFGGLALLKNNLMIILDDLIFPFELE